MACTFLTSRIENDSLYLKTGFKQMIWIANENNLKKIKKSEKIQPEIYIPRLYCTILYEIGFIHSFSWRECSEKEPNCI